jgi:hypothetical protein
MQLTEEIPIPNKILAREGRFYPYLEVPFDIYLNYICIYTYIYLIKLTKYIHLFVEIIGAIDGTHIRTRVSRLEAKKI